MSSRRKKAPRKPFVAERLLSDLDLSSDVGRYIEDDGDVESDGDLCEECGRPRSAHAETDKHQFNGSF